jgi:hypothetical protein
MNVNTEIERHRLPCGPVTVAADAVCRRRLRDTHDLLLDKLSELTSQEYEAPQAPKDHSIEDGKVVHDEVKKAQTEQEAAKKKAEDKAKVEAEKKAAEPSRAEKKKQMLSDAKDKVEVKVKTKEYEEKLMGNSKLLQDPTGKIKPR